jgi:hypothetical protein
MKTKTFSPELHHTMDAYRRTLDQWWFIEYQLHTFIGGELMQPNPDEKNVCISLSANNLTFNNTRNHESKGLLFRCSF